ncbi:Myb-like DNA-binding domain containing protein [Histomonas meleagridis]|uniref:Myb-like DNA-binding domain containing protein n=1 Tax=Histomonas meleagridis TaxID=135588 RepID=UPI003559ED56|nr:Myb-like DNA-binding domain containing protein [Histomonas meleagridis]KAH0799356.1 Myb-like DNA-binding domain containing protein [Histomonas meleagridis]
MIGDFDPNSPPHTQQPQTLNDPMFGQNDISTHAQDLVNFFLKIQQNPKDNTPISRGAWTQQEDEKLVSAVSQLGPKKWTDIAKFVPTRTSKQCRERWENRLKPGIRRDLFEPWEDQVIIQSQKEIGNRWSLIAKKLPGRSSSAVKNRWYSGLRNQISNQNGLELNTVINQTSFSSDLHNIDGPSDL